MLRIRLSRHGAKKDPHYRVVVSEKKSPRDGRFVEVVGYYNPALKPVRLKLDLERVDYWVTRGAQPTQTVRTLIRRVQDSPAGESPASESSKTPAAAASAKSAQSGEDQETATKEPEKPAEEPSLQVEEESRASDTEA